jgi:hypothetical protein
MSDDLEGRSMSDDTRDVLARAVTALCDPHVTTFSRAQLAYLLSLSVDANTWEFAYECGKAAGYQDRRDEEESIYPPPPVFVAGELGAFIDQAEHRRKWDAGELVPPPPAPVRRVVAHQPLGAPSVRVSAGMWSRPDAEPVPVGEFVHGDDHDCEDCAWPTVVVPGSRNAEVPA